MGLDSAPLLLVRGRDLVVLAVRGRGFAQSGASLVAGPDAALVVTFPPQATGELPALGAPPRAAARLSGTSHLTFSVVAGSRIPLTVDGVLEALHGAAAVANTAPAGDTPMAIELPWRVVLFAHAIDSSQALAFDLPPQALDGPSGATGLWRLRLAAATGLALTPIPPFAPDDNDFVPPLNADDRSQIAANGGVAGQEPTAPSLELTALGGSVSAKGTWDQFAWEQRTVLGRDIAVHTVEKGVLYPLGHRAVLVKVTERVLAPDGAGVSAVLQENETLIITDPVVAPAIHGLRALREFPFDTVEILETRFRLGSPSEDVLLTHDRLPKRLEELIADLNQTITDSQEKDQEVAAECQGLHDLGVQGAQDALTAAEIALGEAQATLTPLQQQQDDFDDFVAHDHTGIPSGTSTPVLVGEDDGTATTDDPGTTGDPAPTPPDPAVLQKAKDDVAKAERDREDAQAALERARAAVITEDDLLTGGGSDADLVTAARQLRDDVKTKTQHVKDVKAEAQADQSLPVIGWPLGPDGGRLRFPLRCGHVTFDMPLLFVHDLRFPDTDDFPSYVSLTDTDARRTLESTWQQSQHGVVPLNGVRINVVPSAQPQPTDVHEVHRMTVVAGPHEEPIRPKLDSFDIDLPTVRTLLPTAASRVTAAFDGNYLAAGGVPDVALRLPNRLGVNFRSAADRAGALIVPAFEADVISRAHGLVDSGMLSAAPSLGTIFADAKLLGVDLASVIDGVPRPLGVVPVLEGTRPVGARMSWDLKLKGSGPLRTKPTSALTLTVERSPAKVETTCKVVDVALVLPPTGSELIRVDFGAVEFSQTAERPPHLDVHGVDVTVGGALNLLRTLEDAVDLGSAAPAVHQTPTGISAGYALTVPEVGAGAFTLSNIAVYAGVDVPFDGHPVVATLSFATRDNPFNLSVSGFGGGGYLSFQIAERGIRQLEASLDFGASVSIGVGLASAEVHALGGVRFVQQDGGDVTAVGFLNIGGSVDVLGLVSVSVELEVDLIYTEVRDEHTHALLGEALKGRATLVIEVDVTFWSGSIELDSGEYTFAGPTPPAVPARDVTSARSVPTLPAWRSYRDKFAPTPA